MTDPAVLMVDDDALSRRIMQMIFAGRMNLSRITFFEDSVDFAARVAALAPRPDIVLLDVHVAPMDGFSMHAALKAMPDFAGIPIVALTASVMADEVVRLRETGFHSIIAKPVDLEAFPEMFMRMLAGERLWTIAG